MLNSTVPTCSGSASAGILPGSCRDPAGFLRPPGQLDEARADAAIGDLDEVCQRRLAQRLRPHLHGDARVALWTGVGVDRVEHPRHRLLDGRDRLGAGDLLDHPDDVADRLLGDRGGDRRLAREVAVDVQWWLDALPGDYLANAAVVGLVALAMAAAVAGLGTLLGAGGVVLAALAVFLLGNPLSGLTSAPEMLPQPWGALGQFLPPGAGGTLLRSVAFFDGAGAAVSGWVLGAWAGVGLALAAATEASRLRLPAGGHAREPAAPLRNPA